MNSYASVNLFLSNHAYDEYCERVELTEREKLRNHCQQQLNEGNYGYNKEWFIHLDGVWWVYDIKENGLVLITCYGKTDMDVPKGLKWAKKHQDRLDLNNMIYSEVAE